jgi:adenosylmethionine-8-amino-7-oxononanoate aminotransferase
MLSLLSTLGGLLISGLPKVLDFFQDKADKKHEMELARVQTERELALAERGFIAQQKVEEIRTDQIAMQSEAKMTEAALAHDAKILDKSSKWVVNYVGTVRPTVTYILILELVAINMWIMWHIFSMPGVINNIDDVLKFADVVFSQDEIAMLGGIVGYWFGSRGWAKK